MDILSKLYDAMAYVERWDYRVKDLILGEEAYREVRNADRGKDIDLVTDPGVLALGTRAHMWGACVKVGPGAGWHVTVVPDRTDPDWPVPDGMEEDLAPKCLGGFMCDDPDCVIRSVLES